MVICIFVVVSIKFIFVNIYSDFGSYIVREVYNFIMYNDNNFIDLFLIVLVEKNFEVMIISF